jgi:hypothetical protein
MRGGDISSRELQAGLNLVKQNMQQKGYLDIVDREFAANEPLR